MGGREFSLLGVVHVHYKQYTELASFPGPAQLSVLKATESWAGPGTRLMLSNTLAVASYRQLCTWVL